jgi:hypothetical protein
VVAPDLFNIVLDYIMEAVARRIPGIQLQHFTLCDLEYADDTALFAGSRADIIRALEVMRDEAAKLGMKINWAKTKVMLVGSGPVPPPLLMEGQQVEFVENFLYLGSKISRKGDCEVDIQQRIGKAAGVMRSLTRPLWRHHQVSIQTKMRVYNAAVLSVLMYGSETWALTEKQTRKLDAFDLKLQRQIIGIRWFDFITNHEVRRRTGQPPLSVRLSHRRLSWLGHLFRRPLSCPARQLYIFNPRGDGWRRYPVRPKTRWGDAILTDLRQFNIPTDNVQTIAQDRLAWRRLLRSGLATLSEQAF